MGVPPMSSFSINDTRKIENMGETPMLLVRLTFHSHPATI
jgi:hypothetical protein